MSAPEHEVLVLTYHSISSAPGPTSITPESFRMQMELLAEHRFTALTCQGFLDWRQARDTTDGRRVLITFDDGFADFSTAALPVLRAHGFSCMVFVPTGKLGGREDWRGANASPRPLLDWPAVIELAQAGVEFGCHGVDHLDLTRLAADRRRDEIRRCAQALFDRTGRRARAFAAPYGSVDRAVLADVAATYDVAFGTRFDVARATCDLYDVPRIEMHYFRPRRHWNAFLRGDRSYFRIRQALRAMRSAMISCHRKPPSDAANGEPGDAQ